MEGGDKMTSSAAIICDGVQSQTLAGWVLGLGLVALVLHLKVGDDRKFANKLEVYFNKDLSMCSMLCRLI
jgi:hypothetical protein